jgi:hypothetical protein
MKGALSRVTKKQRRKKQGVPSVDGVRANDAAIRSILGRADDLSAASSELSLPTGAPHRGRTRGGQEEVIHHTKHMVPGKVTPYE